MFQYRQVLVRMRQGDTDREIARAGLMDRPKAARLRGLAAAHGWLEPEAPLPDDAAIAEVIGAARRARSTVSSVEPYRALVERCLRARKIPMGCDAGLAIRVAGRLAAVRPERHPPAPI